MVNYMYNGAEALVKSLEVNGVKYVFGIPGTHILAVYDRIAASSVKSILVTHEPSAGFMADVYGRVSKKPGVILLTSGPGALNVVNAIAQAYVESSPVVTIASQVNQKLWGKGAYHELKSPDVQFEIFKQITKLSSRASTAKEIPRLIDEAISEAVDGRNRPVYLEIPENLFEEPSSDIQSKKNITIKRRPAISELKEFINKINLAKRPIIIAGGGIVSSQAQKELEIFSERLNIPIATTFMGKSACRSDYIGNIGLCSGILADETTNNAINNSDLIIGIGTRFDELATGFFSLKMPNEFIHIDIDSSEFNRVYPATLTINSDAKQFLIMAIDSIKSISKKIKLTVTTEKVAYANRTSNSNIVNPNNLMYQLFDQLHDKKTIFVGDSGNSALWLIESNSNKNHTIITPSGYNSMGFALPGAIGAKLADPEKTVIAICGDGSFLMTGLEFITAVKYGVKIIAIVLHDNRYNILTFFQDIKFGGRHTDTNISTFDIARFANEVGGEGISINDDSEIAPMLSKALKSKKPCIIDVRINPIILPKLSQILANKTVRRQTIS